MTDSDNTIRIPTEIQVLRQRLNGLGRLLTARKWERAAIVYAFTEVGDIGRGRWYKPDPPKMHIREFAAMGFTGLTTNKAVSRYRDAWVKAIDNGWAVPVRPGQLVKLPDREFPAWPYGGASLGEIGGGNVTVEVREDGTVVELDSYREPVELDSYRDRAAAAGRSRRPLEARVMDQIDEATRLLSQFHEQGADELDPELRNELHEKLKELQRLTREIQRALRRNLASV